MISAMGKGAAIIGCDGFSSRAIIWRMLVLFVVMAFVGASGWLDSVQAQHVIVLKNGRQITVQSYREEGSMIKFTGLGGEIGLPKDQIQAILKPGQSNRPGVSIPELEAASAPPATSQQKSATPSAPGLEPRPQSADETTSTNDEEKEYQKRLAEVTQKLEKANRDFFEASQGGGTEANVTKEGLRSWTMDLASRIHDSQKVPGGGGDSSTPPTPPYAPVYTPKEKELSDLRAQVDRLQKERDALIQEMKSRKIPAS
jgi:hypothetical protein